MKLQIALSVPAAAVFLVCYGRGVVLGLARMAWTGLTMPRSSTGCCGGLNERNKWPLACMFSSGLKDVVSG